MAQLTLEEIKRELSRRADPVQAGRMATEGYVSTPTLGVSLDDLWSIAIRIRHDHDMAAVLWEQGGREHRLLACFIEESNKVTAEQMENWVAAFDSLELTEQCCLHPFSRSPHAKEKAPAWSERDEEYVRHAGFLLMTRLGIWREGHPDARFKGYFSYLPTSAYLAAHPDNWWRRAGRWFMRRLSGPNRRRAWNAIEDAHEVTTIRPDTYEPPADNRQS